MSRRMLDCHSLGRECYWHLVGTGRDASKYPVVRPSQQRIIVSKMPVVARLRNSDLDEWFSKYGARNSSITVTWELLRI